MDFFKYFFRSTIEYNNFDIFGPEHIVILFIGALGVLFMLNKININRKIERTLGVVLLTQQVVLYTWYIVTGYKLLTEGLPLYHCRIAIILTGIGLFFDKSICRNLGSMWGLVGSVFALIYPSGLDSFMFPHITQFSFFIGHLFLLWSSVYCIFIKGIKLDEKDFKIIIYFTNIYHVLMFILNHMIDANYGYMRISPINIGNNLHPVVYGLIIITISNLLILFTSALVNKQQKSNNLIECLCR